MKTKKKTLTLDVDSLDSRELYRLLVTAIAPRPICFASTVDSEGRVNLSPFSYFNVFSANPPIMVFSPARSGRDNSTKDTYKNIKEVPEVVINVVNHPMVEQMSLSSTAYSRGINEFIKAGFHPVPSDKVKPPRVQESPVSFECTVDRVIELGDGPGAGNLILARVLHIHLDDRYTDANGRLSTEKLDLVARMGEDYYCRASGDALFKIPKPLGSEGMGIDRLPESIRTSHLLTGNHLGRLGTLEKLPDTAFIDKIKTSPEYERISTEFSSDPALFKQKVTDLALENLKENHTKKAIALLLTINN